MPDREKVIKGWECHMEADTLKCADCPYREGWRTCNFADTLFKDVYAMLKEQAWHLLTEDADGIIHGLPGDDGQYLMTDGKDFWIDDYVDGVTDGIFLDSGRDIREIKAWMYLPEFSMEGK